MATNIKTGRVIKINQRDLEMHLSIRRWRFFENNPNRD
jgi:hypothetical protein